MKELDANYILNEKRAFAAVDVYNSGEDEFVVGQFKLTRPEALEKVRNGAYSRVYHGIFMWGEFIFSESGGFKEVGDKLYSRPTHGFIVKSEDELKENEINFIFKEKFLRIVRDGEKVEGNFVAPNMEWSEC